MVYLIDEYYKCYPDRVSNIKPLMDRFVDSEKYLHEYTLEELNAEVSTWDSLKMSTFKSRRRGLALYLYWLIQQGVEAHPEITKQIVFPQREEKFLIYSTDEIHSLWEDFLFDVQAVAVEDNVPFSPNSLLVCYVAGILSFYGMTRKQIMKLQLSDVQPDGIIGYELPLTPKDIEVLLRYKNYHKQDNGKALIGTTYIRSTIPDPDDLILTRALGKVKCSSEMTDVKKVLSCNKLYLLGIFNRIFEYEKTHEPKLDSRNGVPEWFLPFANEINSSKSEKSKSYSTVSMRKRDYIKYRTERIAYINVMTNQIKNVSSLNSIIERFDSVIQKVGDNDIRSELISIEKLLKQLVK